MGAPWASRPGAAATGCRGGVPRSAVLHLAARSRPRRTGSARAERVRGRRARSLIRSPLRWTRRRGARLRGAWPGHVGAVSWRWRLPVLLARFGPCAGRSGPEADAGEVDEARETLGGLVASRVAMRRLRSMRLARCGCAGHGVADRRPFGPRGTAAWGSKAPRRAPRPERGRGPRRPAAPPALAGRRPSPAPRPVVPDPSGRDVGPHRQATRVGPEVALGREATSRAAGTGAAQQPPGGPWWATRGPTVPPDHLQPVGCRLDPTQTLVQRRTWR